MATDLMQAVWKVSPRSPKTVRAITGPKTDVLVATAATAALAAQLVAQHNAALNAAPATGGFSRPGRAAVGGF